MVRSMMSQTTLPKSFWDYALESVARILNMVSTKKVEKTPYEVLHRQNKVFVAQNAKFFENSLINQEASGSLEDLEIIQEEDMHPSLDTSLNHEECAQEINEPQKFRAIGILIAVAAFYDYEIWKMDVKTAFLNEYLNEEVYMEQPEGEVAYILGIKIYRDRSKRLIGLCKSAYIKKILKRYFMKKSNSKTIPMQEKLKLSKSQGASTLAGKQRMENIPYASANQGELHLTTVKNIIKYLRNTKDMFLVYGGDTKLEPRVSCYTDAGYLTDADDLKSQTRYVFVVNGGDVDWKSTKQSIFETSSIDVEYITAFDASKEAVWILKFIYGLDVVPTIEEPIGMYCDNTRAIAIAKDHGITKGARHFCANRNDCVKNEGLEFSKHSELTRKIGMIPASGLMSVIGERVRVISMGSLPCVRGSGGDFCLEAMEDDEGPLVDGVFEGAFGELSDKTWYFGEGVLVSSRVRSMNNCFGEIMLIFGRLKGLEVEALVDAMEVMGIDDK
ncbi:retrotransposon protein, putative, ty1-copia subclass [Tanacetum coccineum]